MFDGKKDGAGVLYDSETKDLTYCYWKDDRPWLRVRVVSSDKSYIVIPELDSLLNG